MTDVEKSHENKQVTDEMKGNEEQICETKSFCEGKCEKERQEDSLIPDVEVPKNPWKTVNKDGMT